jgi:tight adherence protein C
MILMASIFTFACVFLIAYGLSLQVAAQRTSRSLSARFVWELSTSAQQATRASASPFKKISQALYPLNSRLVAGNLRENLERRLFGSGVTFSAFELMAAKELAAVFCFLLYMLMFGASEINPLYVAGSLGIGFFLPDFWVAKKKQARQRAIIKALPETIDLLNLCVGAGLDFMLAVKWVIEKSKPSPLIDELNQLWQETKVGQPRRQALKNLARRVDLPDINSFVRTLVQADRMGTSIAEALKLQSEEARLRRFQRGERLALQAPIKMLLPLLFFILPVVLIIIGGPILLQFLKSGPII